MFTFIVARSFLHLAVTCVYNLLFLFCQFGRINAIDYIFLLPLIPLCSVIITFLLITNTTLNINIYKAKHQIFY